MYNSMHRRQHAETVLDDMARADDRACAAAQAALRVDDRVELHKVDGVCGTVLHAQAAGDAAHIADRACTRLRRRVEALIKIRAQRLDAVVQQAQMDDAARADERARAAA